MTRVRNKTIWLIAPKSGVALESYTCVMSWPYFDRTGERFPYVKFVNFLKAVSFLVSDDYARYTVYVHWPRAIENFSRQRSSMIKKKKIKRDEPHENVVFRRVVWRHVFERVDLTVIYAVATKTIYRDLDTVSKTIIKKYTAPGRVRHVYEKKLL